jgi:hypothetical protein
MADWMLRHRWPAIAFAVLLSAAFAAMAALKAAESGGWISLALGAGAGVALAAAFVRVREPRPPKTTRAGREQRSTIKSAGMAGAAMGVLAAGVFAGSAGTALYAAAAGFVVVAGVVVPAPPPLPRSSDN